MSPDGLRLSASSLSRREFLAATAAATVGAAGLGCEGTTEPEDPVFDPNPDNLKAVIDGVTSPIQMTRLGGFGTETIVSGANSTPKELIENYRWSLGKDGLEGITSLVNYGEEIDLKFPFTENILELRVSGGSERRSLDSTRAIVEVSPPVLSGTNYEDTQIAFFRWEYPDPTNTDSRKRVALYFMDRDSPELVSRIIPPASLVFDVDKIIWAPTAEELAYVTISESNKRLVVTSH